LYPFVCWHVGAKQSSVNFISEVVRQVRDDPLARWLYMGDAGECVIKASKGNLYEQTLNPGDQRRVAVALMQPVRDKAIGGIRGNHGNRIDKEVGLGWDETLCALVGMPYFGVSCFGNIVLRASSTARLNVSLYAHHGTTAAVTAGGKTNAALKPEQFVVSDLVLTAHSHACGEIICPRHFALTDARERTIKWRTQRAFLCGSAYDSRSGYAEDKMYPPILPEHLCITLRAEMRSNGRVQLIVDHRKIEGFGNQYANEEELDKWAGRLPTVPEAATRWLQEKGPLAA
jgi:hypothetical protein